MIIDDHTTQTPSPRNDRAQMPQHQEHAPAHLPHRIIFIVGLCCGLGVASVVGIIILFVLL